MSSETRTNLLRLAGLLSVILMSAVIYAFRDQVRGLAMLGYPGIFVAVLLSNATSTRWAWGWLPGSAAGLAR